jgi:hypothetical protein
MGIEGIDQLKPADSSWYVKYWVHGKARLEGGFATKDEAYAFLVNGEHEGTLYAEGIIGPDGVAIPWKEGGE